MFKCGICGTEYNTVDERAKCEADCLRIKRSEELAAKMAEQRERAEKEKAAKEEAMKATEKAMNDAYADYCAKRDAHIAARQAYYNQSGVKYRSGDIFESIMEEIFG